MDILPGDLLEKEDRADDDPILRVSKLFGRVVCSSSCSVEDKVHFTSVIIFIQKLTKHINDAEVLNKLYGEAQVEAERSMERAKKQIRESLVGLIESGILKGKHDH